MIEINYNKESKNLTESKYVKSIILDLNNRTDIYSIKKYDSGDLALSFSKIVNASNLIEKSKTYLVLMNPNTYKNIMVDLSALRRYDSTIGDNFFKLNGVKTALISSKLINENESFIVSVKNNDLLEESLEIKLGSLLKISLSKDLTKIPIKLDDYIKITNIVNCY